MRRGLVVVALLLLALLDGCSCRKKSDEEILRKKIDVTKVHLWLAAKIALHEDEGSGETKKARKHLLALIEAAQEKDGGKVDIGPKEAATVAVALFELRALGKEALKKDDPRVPKPILKSLLKVKGELGDALDANLEHAAFLVTLTVAKVHPKLQIPIPPELLLYEAFYTKAGDLPLPTMVPIVRGVKAWVYGTSELCDLAAKEADALSDEDEALDVKKIVKDAKVLGADDFEVVASDGKELSAAISTLANGATALCYVQRDEPEKSTKHLRRVLDDAEAIGMSGPQIDFLRGYVECADGDASKGKKLLSSLKKDDAVTATQKQAIDAVLERCGKGNGKVAAAMNRVALGTAIALVAWDEAERAGLVDALAGTKLARTVLGVVHAVNGSVDAAKGSIPSVDEAKETAKGWWPPW